MKGFIICMETAFIAFCIGAYLGAENERQKYQKAEESSEEATPV